MSVADAAEVDTAVQAARAAQPRWAALSGAERARILRRAADILRARNDELAELETRDTGKPIQETWRSRYHLGRRMPRILCRCRADAAGEHIDLGPQASAIRAVSRWV